MADGKVTVLAIMTAKAGREDEVLKEMQALIEPTRSEEGCINYDLHRSLEDPAKFMFHENWRSKQDLDQHLAKPYLVRFLGLAGEFLTGPAQVSVWQEIGSR
jgi:quinol monooxygenase YgiN